MNHDALTDLEMALRSAERNLATARLQLKRLIRKCQNCGEPLDSIESGLCAWCDKMGAAIDGEVA